VELPSPNHDSRGHDARGDTPIDMLVLHYTGMRSAKEALDRLCDPAAKVSAHYTIDEDGTVYAHVPEARRAWHAGVGRWAGATDINTRSIGIELVNPGHEFGYREFADTQIASLTTLCHSILMRHPIPSWRVLGHSDVAPARKEDPGELGPNWRKRVSAFGRKRLPVSWMPRRWRVSAMTRMPRRTRRSPRSSAISGPKSWTAYGIANAPGCWLPC
jgi:N-acetyl-anhydromuramyl-L-alanine amidase AmpD